MMFKPWPHQLEARDKLRTEVSLGRKRPICMAPCGAGKSYIAALLLQGTIEKGNTALILAPQIELVDQMAHKFRHDYHLDCGIVMRGRPYEPWKNIQIASVQTLWSRAYHSGSLQKPPANVVILDEAHLFASELRQKILRDYDHVPIIGLTATPIGPAGSGLGNVFDSIIVAARYDKLRKDGILVPCRIFAPNKPDMKGVKIQQGDYHQVQAAERMQPLIGDIYEHWRKHALGKRTLLFAASVAQSQWICENAFLKNGIPAAHIDGTMDKESERNPIMAQLRSGEIKVLTTCNVLSEGTDIPQLEGLINAAPTKSMRRWRQRMGRVLRACPSINKKEAIIIDHAGACLLHGYPDTDIDWDLDTSRKALSKENQRQKEQEKKSIICKECDAYFTNSPVCPYCGWQIPNRKRSTTPNIHDGNLELFKRHERGKKDIVAEQKLWNQCLAIAANSFKVGTFRMALAIFRRKSGHWPSNAIKNRPDRNELDKRVAIVYPNFIKRQNRLRGTIDEPMLS